MKFAFFTFSGYSLPIAKRLLDEGNGLSRYDFNPRET